MKVLVTGGAGFIGSFLSECLLNGGHHVEAIDDLSTGSMANVNHLTVNPNYNISVDTIFNEATLSDHIDRCDAVVHLAAAVGVRLIVESPVRTIETNVHGTEAVLRHAQKGRKLVIIASTSEVYGKRTNVPFKEDSDLLLGPPSRYRWAYATSKALDEFLGFAYWKERQLPVIVVRLFNTIGPRQTGRYGMVVPTFVSQALAGDPITVFGNGSQTRSFTDISDVVRALTGLLNEPQAVGEVINIGNPEEISILALAELVKTVTQSTSRIITVPYEQAYETGFEDMPRRVPDIAKIRTLIGWQPTVMLKGSLERVVQSVRNNNDSGTAVSVPWES